MLEAVGFWVAFGGWTLLLVSSTVLAKEAAIQWVEERLRVPWYVQVFAPLPAAIIMMVGWHIWCLENRGRYPGYPLDVLIEWFLR